MGVLKKTTKNLKLKSTFVIFVKKLTKKKLDINFKSKEYQYYF